MGYVSSPFRIWGKNAKETHLYNTSWLERRHVQFAWWWVGAFTFTLANPMNRALMYRGSSISIMPQNSNLAQKLQLREVFFEPLMFEKKHASSLLHMDTKYYILYRNYCILFIHKNGMGYSQGWYNPPLPRVFSSSTVSVPNRWEKSCWDILGPKHGRCYWHPLTPWRISMMWILRHEKKSANHIEVGIKTEVQIFKKEPWEKFFELLVLTQNIPVSLRGNSENCHRDVNDLCVLRKMSHGENA